MERFCELSLRYRPTGLYNFGSVLINAVREVCERRGFDPRDVFASYKGVVFAGEPLSPRARALAESWGVELFEHRGVGDVTAAFECAQHDGLHVWEDTVLVEGLDPDGTDAVADGERCELVATSLFNRTAPLDPVPLRRHRAPHRRDRARAGARTRGCGRSAARATRSSSTAGSVLPIDVWAAVESVDACAMGLFQVIRTDARGRHAAAARRVRARRARTRLDSVARRRARPRCSPRLGVEPDVELVPERGAAASSVRRTRSRGWRSDDRRRDASRCGRRRATTTARPARRRGRSRTTRSSATSGAATRRARRARRRAAATRVLCCSMLVGGGPVLAVHRRHDAGRRAALVRRRDRRRGGARRDVPAARGVRRGARRDRRDPRRPRRARSSVRRRVRRCRHRRRPPERVRAARGRRADAAPLRRVRTGGRDRREPGAPALVDADEWELDVDATTVACSSPACRPRATEFVRDPTAVRGTPSTAASFRDVPREAVMTKRALISADNHVFEPVTLWQERLPDGVPRARAAARAARRLARDGDRGHARPQAHARRRRRARTARRAVARDRACAPAAPTPTRGCSDMALDGVVAEVIYPTFGLFIDMIPARRPADGVRAGLQRLARGDVPAPARRVHPVRGRAGARRRVGGGRARTRRRARLQGRDDPDDAAGGHAVQPARASTRCGRSRATRGMPLSLHTGTGALPQHERGPGGAVINYAKVGLLSAETLCYFAASGVLERFPDLRLVFVETGAGWLAYCCERMDEAFEEHEQWVNPKLARPPSAYVQRAVLRDARRRPRAVAHARDHRRRAAAVGERLPAPGRHVPRESSRSSSASSRASPKPR